MEPFVLTDCALISIATGEMAHNLRELSDRLRRMEDPAITYFHFWGLLLICSLLKIIVRFPLMTTSVKHFVA